MTSASGTGYKALRASSAAGFTGVNAIDRVHHVVDDAVDRVRLASDQLVDLSAIASNTGCTSLGELADYLQNVGRRRLSLQERVLGGYFFEEPRILDGDYGLIGEGLKQLYVMGWKRARLYPRDADGADRLPSRKRGMWSMLR